jgi:hypothetical protein
MNITSYNMVEICGNKLQRSCMHFTCINYLLMLDDSCNHNLFDGKLEVHTFDFRKGEYKF